VRGVSSSGLSSFSGMADSLTASSIILKLLEEFPKLWLSFPKKEEMLGVGDSKPDLQHMGSGLSEAPSGQKLLDRRGMLGQVPEPTKGAISTKAVLKFVDNLTPWMAINKNFWEVFMSLKEG